MVYHEKAISKVETPCGHNNTANLSLSCIFPVLVLSSLSSCVHHQGNNNRSKKHLQQKGKTNSNSNKNNTL